MQVATDWAWWLGLLAGAVPVIAVALWHCNDVCHRATFWLMRWRRGRPGQRQARLPPGHMGLPFAGESLALLFYFKVLRRPDGFVRAKVRRHGAAAGVYRTHLFGSPAVLVCSPAANKFVLQSPDCFPMGWPSPELVGLTAVGNVEGGQHARLRRFILAAINRPSALRTTAEVVQPHIAAALRSWADQGTITAAAEIKKLMFESICKMFVSMEPSSLTGRLDGWFAGLVAGIKAFPLDFPGTAFRHAHKCRKKLDQVFREEVQRRRKLQQLTSSGKDDLMSGLMLVEDEQGKKLSDDEVVDNIISLIIGAYETTSNAIMWAAYHLAKSPHVLQKLREENVAIIKDSNGAFLTVDDIPKMKYTAKVVEETIRVANIAPMLFRVASKDVEYRGYTIPKGWRVVVWLRSLHTDADYYNDPLSFIPDRWDKPAKPGTFQVFGSGQRICAGNMLARLMLTIMLHHLSIGYRWELLNPDAEVVYLPHSKPVDGAAMSFGKL